jgi:hypothetical protein
MGFTTVQNEVLDLALERTDLSPRELATEGRAVVWLGWKR